MSESEKNEYSVNDHDIHQITDEETENTEIKNELTQGDINDQTKIL